MDSQIDSQQWAENMGFITPTKPSASLTSIAVDPCSESDQGKGALHLSPLRFWNFFRENDGPFMTANENCGESNKGKGCRSISPVAFLRAFLFQKTTARVCLWMRMKNMLLVCGSAYAHALYL